MRLFILFTAAVMCNVMASEHLVDSGFSGQWYSTGRSGEGWVLEELDNGRAVVYWFTYDSVGSQKWFIATGDRSVGEETVSFDFPDVYVTEGGKFGPEGSNDGMVQQEIGELRFAFTSCASGIVEYTIKGEHAERDISRLGNLMNTDCAADGSELRTYAPHTGSWYDVNDSGEGLILQWLDRDEAVLLWFTYDDMGNQFWLIGTGQYLDGEVIFSDLLSTQGGVFGDAFDEEEVETSHWGSAVLDLECSSGAVEFSSVNANFGSGSIALDRLTRLEGFECPLFMPSVADPETADWDDRFTIAGVSWGSINAPYVFDLFETADGRLLAGGLFSWFGPNRVPSLIEVQGDSSWQSMPGVVNQESDAVSAISEVPEKGVVLAGDGTIEIYSAEGLEQIGTYEGWVRRMVWYDGNLWAAGAFSMGSEGPEHLALWDGNAWHDAPGGAPDGPVFSVEAASGSLYLGGEFENIGGIESPSVAGYDASGWMPMGMPSETSTSSRVLALEILSDGSVLAGGDLLPAFGDSGGAVVRWNGTEWSALGEGFWNREFPGVVSDLEAVKDDLYAVGCFDSIGAPSDESGIASQGIARWNGEAWQSLDGGDTPIGISWIWEPSCGWEPNPLAVADIEWNRLKRYEGSLYIAGRFPGVAGVPSQSLIAFDGQEFVAQGETDLGTHGDVDGLALMPPDNELYAFGPLRFGGTLAHSRLARLDEAGWTPVGTELPQELNCRDGRVADPLVITPEQRILLACNGNLTGRPEDSFGQILELRNGEWIKLFSDEEMGPIWDIQVDSVGNVWFSGGNDLPEPYGYVRRLPGEDGNVFSEDGFDSIVSAISVDKSKEAEVALQVLAAGSFTSVNGAQASSLALWKGGSWQSVGGGLASPPSAILLKEDIAYVANATLVGEEEKLPLAIWDGGAWENLATQERNFPMHDTTVLINTIRKIEDRLYLAGQIIPETDTPEFGLNLLQYEDGEFKGVSGGIAGLDVSTMAFQDNAIVVGGKILEADPYGDPRSSIGLARLIWK